MGGGQAYEGEGGANDRVYVTIINRLLYLDEQLFRLHREKWDKKKIAPLARSTFFTHHDDPKNAAEYTNNNTTNTRTRKSRTGVPCKLGYI